MISFKELGSLGRLGNQLFQIATTISLALDHNNSYIFPPWKYEPYFNLHNCFSAHIENSETYRELFFHYFPVPYKFNLNLSGFFQSPLYFEKHKDFIRKVFTTNYKLHSQPNATSLHIRRGDYLKFSDYHTNLDINYYRQAMTLCPSEKYYIFSDDTAWCKTQFIGNQFVFMENNHETFDIDMMSKCANNILANSSFSWWGAWLNDNPNKKVIAPKNWFGPKLQHNIKDLLPETWIKI